MKYVFILASSVLLLSCGDARATLPAAPSVPPANYTIAGTVRDTAGRAIEGVDIFMIVATKGSPAFKTDAAGGYQIRVPGGIHSFNISKPGFRPRLTTVRVDSDTIADFVLEPATGP